MRGQSHQEKAIGTGTSSEKNSSLKTEPTWSMKVDGLCGFVNGLSGWFPGCGMDGCLSITDG